MKVAVLLGGTSAEREVSIETGTAIAGALRELGHEVAEVDVDSSLPMKLADVSPDAVFMALHGRGGEDGTVQGLLEIMRIPYTGCGVLASAMTMDKVVTKEIIACHGVPVVEDVVLEVGCGPEQVAEVEALLGFPVMVKPASEGSSIGVVRADNADELRSALEDCFSRDGRALIERFIEGRQFTVGVLGREPVALPVLEIIVSVGFYDFDAKYRSSTTTYEVPAKLDPEVSEEIQRLALVSFECLYCEGISRIDFMIEAATGNIYELEVNTIPGMTAASLVPKAAGAVGMTFNEVVAKILEGASLKVDIPG